MPVLPRPPPSPVNRDMIAGGRGGREGGVLEGLSERGGEGEREEGMAGGFLVDF